MSLAQKTISFKALQRCRTTIEDFACTYFPLHGLDVAQGLFQYLDILLFVEATIYQMDEENEALCEQLAQQQDSQTGQQAGAEDAQQQQQPEEQPEQQPEQQQQEQQLTFEAQEVLLQVLQQQLLLSDRVSEELTLGQQYWRQERHICSQLAATQPGHAAGLSLSEVVAAHEAKSFDYRVLHLLLHGLLRKPLDEALLAFMRLDEMLIDIGDDLTDYEDDVMANSFNIYRGFIHLYGKEAPTNLAARISHLEARRGMLLAQLPQGLQQKVLKRQREAATEEGADKWVFPDPILDEPAYRRHVRQLEGSA
uniref:Uncharacterized protein n=1 Tax=Tetradesmus obliquus TaxID=3088 RepID=A0A383VVX6_TETOB|eukprot:jgi/Sobl393_1/6044/SZX69638.1